MSITKELSRSPLLLHAILTLLISATAFSPLFAREMRADFVCSVTNQCFPGDKTACENACKNSDGTQGICSSLGFPLTCGTLPPEATKAMGADFGALGGWLLKYTLQVISYVLGAISTILERLVAWSSFLLEMAINVAQAPFNDVTALQQGWKIMRDVVNSFFVLVLFIIAIATILQLESYAWKQLLPIFIIVALLVNFSFVLTGVVIDFSNILGKTFVDKMQPISDNIARAFDINNINNLQVPTCSAPSASTSGTTGTIVGSAKGWACAGTELFLSFGQVMQLPDDIPGLQKRIFVLFMRNVMLFLFIFPVLAGAILLLIRTVMLMVLIIFAPAAFTAYILPATRGYATQWWTKLFSLAFFFPSYMFILYIAIKYGIAIGNTLKNTGSPLGGTFDNLATIFNYLTMTTFLFIALYIGRSSGIYGAETVMKYTDTARKWATGYAGRMTGVPRLSERLAESGAAQRFAARFPTLGGATLRTLQKGATLGGREAVIKREVDTAMKLAPRYQATAYLKASAPTRKRLEEQMKAEGIAEIMHYTDDQKTREKIKNTAFTYLPPDQHKDSQEKLKIAYADREANKQSTGQLVGRFDSNYYSKEEEEKIFDVAKTDKRAKILLRSTRDIAELEQRMLDGIGTKDVREIERTYDEIARNGVEMNGDALVQKFNKLSKAANQKLYDIIDPGDLREKMAGFADAATLAITPATLTPTQQAALTDVERKQYEQKQFLNKIEGLGTNKRGIEIRKIVGAAGPTYWQELGYGSQRELVEKLTPAEAATMREEDMQQAAISQHFDAGQLEAIGRSQRVAPETRRQVRRNIESWIAAQRAPGPYPPLTPEEDARFTSLENYLNTSPGFR